MSDPNYWKYDYSAGWAGHKKNVQALASKLMTRFPQISLSYGYGATSDEFIDGSQPKRDEPDIYINNASEQVCTVEVSGSDKVRVPPNAIWVRLGKYEYAKKKLPAKSWFFMVYPLTSSIFLLDVADIQPYENKVLTKKLSTTGYQKPEKYIEIPHSII